MEKAFTAVRLWVGGCDGRRLLSLDTVASPWPRRVSVVQSGLHTGN